MKRKRILISFAALFLTAFTMAQENNSVETRVKKGSIQWESKDKQFTYSFGGRIYLDAAAYSDDKTDLGSGSELRDLRLLLKATLWEDWNAKINIGFAEGKVSPKDIFLQYNINKNSYIRSGYFFEPFGLERTESSKTTKFMHLSSTTEAFGPGRNLGVEYSSWGKNTYMGIGLFGDTDVNNTTGGDEAFALTSRLVYAPMNENGRIFHIGAAVTYRTADAAGTDGETKSIRYRSRAATHVEGRRFIDAKVNNANYQIKYGLELLAASGTISLQGEYIGAWVNRKRLEGGVSDAYKANGSYAQLGWLLKGDSYKYKMASARLVKPEPGALELLLRYNLTDLNDSDAAILGGEQKDISVGFNYYINHNIMVRLNYTNVDLDRNALNGEENFNMLQARLQMAF